jgi:hypothetical protein
MTTAAKLQYLIENDRLDDYLAEKISAYDALAPISRAKNTMWVDPSFTGTSDGSVAAPYTTIQAALTAIGAPVNSADCKNQWTVLISPGCYDESLTVYGRRSVSLLGLGPWVLGDGANGNFASTTPRNITIQNDYSTWFSEPIRRKVLIGTICSPVMTGSTHIQYHHGVLVSGNITVTNVNNPVGSVNDCLILSGVRVNGNIDYTSANVLPNFAFVNSYVLGTVSSSSTSTGFVYEITNSQVDGLITCAKINRVSFSELKGGVTIGSVDTATQPPCGFFCSQLTGTFTGPANSYRADGTTQALSSTLTLAGGATLVSLA